MNHQGYDNGSRISYQNRPSRANMQPLEYSVWFAKMNNSIKHLYITSCDKFLLEQCILSTGFFGLMCSSMSFAYVASYLRFTNFESIKNTLAHGSTQESISEKDLENIFIPVPPNDLLMIFSNIANPIYKRISTNNETIRHLKQTRDFLLPLLMNGQVTIE